MNSHVHLLYLATWALVAISPGPAVMCAMTLATRYGFRQALLDTTSVAFLVIRIIGALYLLYLGVRIITATFRPRPTAKTALLAPGRRSLLLQGLAIQVTNPKALLLLIGICFLGAPYGSRQRWQFRFHPAHRLHRHRRKHQSGAADGRLDQTPWHRDARHRGHLPVGLQRIYVPALGSICAQGI
jgi:threonine/homoserine/homoserine lactone efflux protein